MAKKSNKEDFIKKAKSIHGERYDYSLVNYINNNTKVIIVCLIHGEFEQIPRSHISGHSCRQCKFDSYKIIEKDFIVDCTRIHNGKYNYSKVKYSGAHKKVTIICPKHGDFKQVASKHKEGYGCHKCSNETKLTTEDVIIQFKSIHNELYDYSMVNYVGDNVKVKIICKKHGEFESAPHNHKRGKGCPICNFSKGELKINSFLSDNKINFKLQHKFDDCRDKNPLPFDFYLPDHNICIEFNGRQHYEIVDYFGGINGLISTQKRDNIKIEYCKNNNIELIIIKHDENLFEVLSNRIAIIT